MSLQVGAHDLNTNACALNTWRQRLALPHMYGRRCGVHVDRLCTGLSKLLPTRYHSIHGKTEGRWDLLT